MTVIDNAGKACLKNLEQALGSVSEAFERIDFSPAALGLNTIAVAGRPNSMLPCDGTNTFG